MKPALIISAIGKIAELFKGMLEYFNIWRNRKDAKNEVILDAKRETEEIMAELRDIPDEFSDDELRESKNNRRKDDPLSFD